MGGLSLASTSPLTGKMRLVPSFHWTIRIRSPVAVGWLRISGLWVETTMGNPSLAESIASRRTPCAKAPPDAR
jgi:hypothetical protein